MFAQLPGRSNNNIAPDRVRQFVGDGTSFLKVEGLKSLESVRIGSMVLPAVDEREYPQTGKKGSFVSTDHPHYQVQKDESGVTYLVRAEISNDGIWQKDAVIYVVGDWEAPSTETPAETPASETPKTPAKDK